MIGCLSRESSVKLNLVLEESRNNTNNEGKLSLFSHQGKWNIQQSRIACTRKMKEKYQNQFRINKIMYETKSLLSLWCSSCWLKGLYRRKLKSRISPFPSFVWSEFGIYHVNELTLISPSAPTSVKSNFSFPFGYRPRISSWRMLYWRLARSKTIIQVVWAVQRTASQVLQERKVFPLSGGNSFDCMLQVSSSLKVFSQLSKLFPAPPEHSRRQPPPRLPLRSAVQFKMD